MTPSKLTSPLVMQVQADEGGPTVIEIVAMLESCPLAVALKDRTIFAAGLDVYEHEPGVHPDLIGLDSVVLAPHIASASVRTRSQMSELAARNMIAGLRGERPPNLLNPEAWRS